MKKERNISFSLLLVPRKGLRLRSVKVSKSNIIMALCAFGILVTVLAVLSFRFIRLNRELAEQNSKLVKLQALAAENDEQRAKLSALDREAAQVREKLASINSLAGQITYMLNIKRTDVSRGLGILPQGTNFPELDKEADQQKERLDSLLEPAENYIDYLSHRPSMLPKNGKISSAYGDRSNPTGSGTEFHDGIDIEADYGDPVYAPGGGVVVFAGWDSGYGLKVTIDHGYGIQTFYGHNSALEVQPGQIVKRGDVIARAGSTGRSTGVHVHWGATLLGQSTNPLNFLADNR